MQSAKVEAANDEALLANSADSPTPIEENDLSERLLNFAARVGKVVNALPRQRLANHIAAQLVRCGTAPAANYEEACAGESRADFIHKLSIVLKELRESRCWIKLIIKAELLTKGKMSCVYDECHQLCAIIAKSIVTAKKNDPKIKANP